MNIKKVINLFGGPCTGKSLVASGLFHQLKSDGVRCELVPEYAKELTYENRTVVLNEDQLYIFAKQHRKLFRIRNEVDVAISDSPLILPIVYFDVHGDSIYDVAPFTELVRGTFNKYPNINIFLKRNPDYPYEDYGRKQTEEESIEIDELIKKKLNLFHIPYIELISDDHIISNIIALLDQYERN